MNPVLFVGALCFHITCVVSPVCIATMNQLLSVCLTAKQDRRQVASEIMREITHLGLGRS